MLLKCSYIYHTTLGCETKLMYFAEYYDVMFVIINTCIILLMVNIYDFKTSKVTFYTLADSAIIIGNGVTNVVQYFLKPKLPFKSMTTINL